MIKQTLIIACDVLCCHAETKQVVRSTKHDFLGMNAGFREFGGAQFCSTHAAEIKTEGARLELLGSRVAENKEGEITITRSIETEVWDD
jgi:hypothetical protein